MIPHADCETCADYWRRRGEIILDAIVDRTDSFAHAVEAKHRYREGIHRRHLDGHSLEAS